MALRSLVRGSHFLEREDTPVGGWGFNGTGRQTQHTTRLSRCEVSADVMSGVVDGQVQVKRVRAGITVGMGKESCTSKSEFQTLESRHERGRSQIDFHRHYGIFNQRKRKEDLGARTRNTERSEELSIDISRILV